MRAYLLVILCTTCFSALGQCNDWDKFISNSHINIFETSTDRFGNVYAIGVISENVQIGNVFLAGTPNLNGFVIKFDKNNQIKWGKSIANSQNGLLRVKVDRSNNVVVAGYFYSAYVEWDCIRLSNSSSRSEVYIAKLAPDGTTLWAKNFIGLDDEYITSLAVGHDNEIVVTGNMVSTSISFDSFSLTNGGGIDSFVAKLGSDGKVIWVKGLGGGNGNYPDYIWSSAIDTSGDVIVGGWFESPFVNFDGFQFNATAISLNYFLAKIHSEGETLWAKGPEAALNYGVNGVATDRSNNVYATGVFGDSPVNFGKLQLPNSGNDDAFVTKYSPDGNVLWARPIGDSGYETGWQLGFDSDGYLYVSGSFSSESITIGSDHFSDSDWHSDIFLTKMDQQGNFICSLRTTGNASPLSMSIDSMKNAYLTVQPLQSDIQFGTQTHSDPDLSLFAVRIGSNTNFETEKDYQVKLDPVYLGKDTTLCSGSLKLTVEAFCNATYLWSTNDNQNSIVVTKPGKYWVDVFVHNTHLRDTIEVSYLDPPIVNLGPDIKKCSFDEISFDLSQANGSIIWSDGTSSTQKLIRDPGRYWVTAENRCGKAVDSVVVTNFPFLNLDLGPDRTVCQPFEIKLEAPDPGAGAVYLWDDGDSGVQRLITHSGKYWVTLRNQCQVVSDTINISFLNPSQLFFPNVITPNGDGKNDFYVLDDRLKGGSFEVFNRWGEQVFFSPNYQNDWNGGDLAPGVYFFYLSVECQAEKIKGSVTILR
jgi:gliding motility-associated-like protein